MEIPTCGSAVCCVWFGHLCYSQYDVLLCDEISTIWFIQFCTNSSKILYYILAQNYQRKNRQTDLHGHKQVWDTILSGKNGNKSIRLTPIGPCMWVKQWMWRPVISIPINNFASSIQQFITLTAHVFWSVIVTSHTLKARQYNAE